MGDRMVEVAGGQAASAITVMTVVVGVRDTVANGKDDGERVSGVL